MKTKTTLVALLSLGALIALTGCAANDPVVDDSGHKTPDQARAAGLDSPEKAQAGGSGGQSGEMNTGA